MIFKNRKDIFKKNQYQENTRLFAQYPRSTSVLDVDLKKKYIRNISNLDI